MRMRKDIRMENDRQVGRINGDRRCAYAQVKRVFVVEDGKVILPMGTSTPFSDLICTATVSEKRNVTLLICVWTVPSALFLAGGFWPRTIPGAAAQRSMN